MPTYAYRCQNCGTESETVQRISEPALTHCDVCGTENLMRVISVGGGFVLKGSGFYNTDYKNSGKPAESAEAKSDAKAEAKPDATSDGKADAKPNVKPETKPDSKAETKSDAKSESKPEKKSEPKPETKPAASSTP